MKETVEGLKSRINKKLEKLVESQAREKLEATERIIAVRKKHWEDLVKTDQAAFHTTKVQELQMATDANAAPRSRNLYAAVMQDSSIESFERKATHIVNTVEKDYSAILTRILTAARASDAMLAVDKMTEDLKVVEEKIRNDLSKKYHDDFVYERGEVPIRGREYGQENHYFVNEMGDVNNRNHHDNDIPVSPGKSFLPEPIPHHGHLHSHSHYGEEKEFDLDNDVTKEVYDEQAENEMKILDRRNIFKLMSEIRFMALQAEMAYQDQCTLEVALKNELHALEAKTAILPNAERLDEVVQGKREEPMSQRNDYDEYGNRLDEVQAETDEEQFMRTLNLAHLVMVPGLNDS